MDEYDADGEKITYEIKEVSVEGYTTEITGDVEEGFVITNTFIEHAHDGASLPSIGGIGTTIFYAVGGIMVLAAAVVLITRRRMAKEE